MLKMAEISSGRSLKPNIPRVLKLGYVLWLQRLKKTSGNTVGGEGLKDVYHVNHNCFAVGVRRFILVANVKYYLCRTAPYSLHFRSTKALKLSCSCISWWGKLRVCAQLLMYTSDIECLTSSNVITGKTTCRCGLGGHSHCQNCSTFTLSACLFNSAWDQFAFEFSNNTCVQHMNWLSSTKKYLNQQHGKVTRWP